MAVGGGVYAMSDYKMDGAMTRERQLNERRQERCAGVGEGRRRGGKASCPLQPQKMPQSGPLGDEKESCFCHLFGGIKHKNGIFIPKTASFGTKTVYFVILRNDTSNYCRCDEN